MMKRLLPFLAAVLGLLVIAIAAIVWFGPGAAVGDAVDQVPQSFDGERALADTAAQMAFGPRPTGSEAHRQAGDYILSELEAAGWQAEEQPFTYQGVEARNLIGKAGDSGPDDPLIVLGAHYDTRMLADQDPEQPDAMVPGANDGASGVAVLLELARVLETDTIGSEVWLVFFDAEDNGNIDGWDWIAGSSYFADNLSDEPTFVIVADMIGDADQQLYYERNSNALLSTRLWATADELGYADSFVPQIRYSMMDDHTPFLERGIPAVDIIDFDYPYWHTTGDTLDKISAESLERVGRTLEVFLEEGRWRLDTSG